METKTENTAAGIATLRPDSMDKYAPDNLLLYRTSLALYRNLMDEENLGEDAYCHIRTILNKKYGLSSGSILQDLLDIYAGQSEYEVPKNDTKEE